MHRGEDQGRDRPESEAAPVFWGENGEPRLLGAGMGSHAPSGAGIGEPRLIWAGIGEPRLFGAGIGESHLIWAGIGEP